MPAPQIVSSDVVRRRPKDRKQQILQVAAEAFSTRGYYAAGMDDIAVELGISATALYRHYANKYDLFRAAVLALGHQLVDATAFCDELDPDTSPDNEQAAMIDALIEVSISNRSRGGLYRWEGRYLQGDGQAELMAQLRLVNRRLQRPLLAARPTITPRERWMLSAAGLSVIGSIADHRAKLPVAQIRQTLSRFARSVLATELLSADDPAVQPAVRPLPAAPSAAVDRYEALLEQSLLLFAKQGFHETSMGEIAAAVGIPTSGIYRYFPGKQDILSAVFHRGADRVSGELSSVASDASEPTAALRGLVAAFVASSFATPELAYIYYTERVNLGPADQLMLRNIQRATVDSWVRLLTEARTDINDGQARFAVHAAMALVIDLGRLVSYDDSAHAQAAVRQLMHVTLGI